MSLAETKKSQSLKKEKSQTQPSSILGVEDDLNEYFNEVFVEDGH